MKENAKTKSSTEKVEVKSEEKEREQIGRKEGRTCNRCKFYDRETERDFRRKVGPKDESGQRTEIVEVRAVCRNPKANAFNHLVHATQLKRKCEFWKEGVYKKPEKKTKKSNSKDEDSMTSPQEYFGTVEGKLEAQTKSKCPKCGSDNVRESSEDSDDEHFECLDCGEEWKRALNGTVY